MFIFYEGIDPSRKMRSEILQLVACRTGLHFFLGLNGERNV